MTISEMHSMFRTLGQMKGMQHVRAILPEEIDDYLNSSIIEFCREKLAAGSATQYPDKVSFRDNAIVPYNSLRTLYKEIIETVNNGASNERYEVDFTNSKSKYIAIVGADINYEENGRRYTCRIVEPTKIGYILNDYCNQPTKTEPICYIEHEVGETATIYLYTNGVKPHKCFIHAFSMPAVVNSKTSTDCDLPNAVHQEIVERAVQNFFTSVGATTHQVKQ